MNDFVQTLWQEFAAESDEHLAVLEPLLVRLGSAEGEAGDVARLFRGFHSLKGLARAMALYGMEAVAHRAENLLGLVRDSGVAMSEPMLDGLLEAVDSLKGLRDAAVGNRADAAAPAALLQKLDALFEAAGGSEAAPVELPPAAGGTAELNEDAEMLDLFVELLQTRLPELARAFDADEAMRSDLIDTLDALENAAGVMQFEQVAETLRDLGGFLAAQKLPLDPAARGQAVDRIAQVALQARLLSEVTGGDAGAQALTEALAGVLTEDRVRTLGGLAVTLGELEGRAQDGQPAERQQVAASAAALAHTAQSILQCLAVTRAAELLLLIEEISARIADGELAPTALLASVMQFTVEAVAEQAEKGLDLDEEQAIDLARRTRSALQPDKESGESEQLDAMLAGLKGRPEMLEVLSADKVGELATGVAGGANVYELMLYLEDSPALGEAIVAWLTAETKIISNRTVLTDGKSWFDFLILSSHPPEAVRAALLLRDPERECVKSLRQVGGEMLLSDEASADEEAAPAEPGARRATEAASDSRSSTVLRVRSDVIDRFMTQIGEIRIAAAELAELTASGGDVARQQEQRGAGELAHRVETDLRRLQASALELRVVPIDTILNRFPRVVRTLAQEQGKNVRLTLEGRDVRVDKSMVELLVDPLMHMVRNAVDHGIEPPDERARAGKPPQASVTLGAVQRGGEVQVQVSDDGRGLNEAAILEKAVARGLTNVADAARLKPHEIHRFIFAPGFSTAAKVTETSGRGVGMDVVLNTVQQLGGDIDVETKAGGGATFTLRLPLSAAMQASLLVRVNGQTFGIAERFVSSVLEVAAEDMLESSGQKAIRHNGMALPVYRLADLLWQDAADGGATPDFLSIVVISNGRETIGLEVDRVRRRQELFLKDLHPLLAACPTVSGAAVLGDGRIVLLLDADELIQLVRSGTWRGAPEAATEAAP
ncbi:MAG: two-component system, chemotaxis family, sensor kinase CheA [Rhodospirillaceae bacterium]|nr:two-component system, chemotaxis family, sensor kinase CheA [Rhodospirillaceae bacterium]